MPDVSEKDVNVILKNGVLTITGTVSTASYEKLAPALHRVQRGQLRSAVHAQPADRRILHQGAHEKWRARSRNAQA